MDDFQNIDIIDTVFIRKSARGFGCFTRFIQERLNGTKDLGFSEPISNKMLVRLLKYLKSNAEARERIWLVNESTGKKVILWWSILRIAKKQNVDLSNILKQ